MSTFVVASVVAAAMVVALAVAWKLKDREP